MKVDLRQIFALRRTMQGFIDDNSALDDQSCLTKDFSIDGDRYYLMTPDQRSVLMALAPVSVREINKR
jgi:hypothetical protein